MAYMFVHFSDLCDRFCWFFSNIYFMHWSVVCVEQGSTAHSIFTYKWCYATMVEIASYILLGHNG